MDIIFLISVAMKGIGAILEILIQILITSETGVSGYGSYSAFISSAELVVWTFFSCLIRCNTFYLSESNSSICHFKTRFYGYYVIPALILICIAGGLFSGDDEIYLIIGIAFFILLVQDKSSILMARKHAITALFGEYILGRAILLTGIALLFRFSEASVFELLWLYLMQCIVCWGYLKYAHIFHEKEMEQKSVSLIKLRNYQFADILQMMITQVPVVLQYLFEGAFEAGVVSIVLLVKKLINFITGPSAKIFLPEFARYYKKQDMNGLRSSFATIMRIQMLFVCPLSVVMIGFPDVILRILASELIPYKHYLIFCSIVFLVSASLGPCGGVMQMTGNEKKDNYIRICAMGSMVLVFMFMLHNQYFVLYGLCVETAIEAIGKYIYICNWMKKSPVSILEYMKWWIVPVIIIGISYYWQLNQSFMFMVGAAAFVCMWGLIKEYQNTDSGIRKLIAKDGNNNEI